jgi:hypothetical protein
VPCDGLHQLCKICGTFFANLQFGLVMFEFSARVPSPVGKVKNLLLCFKRQELATGVNVYQW